MNTIDNIKTTLQVVCGKWKGVILIELFDDSLRFSDIKRRVPGIHHQTLVKQLKELEEDKLITRYAHPVVPPKVEYSITEYGKSILPLLKEMNEWGKFHREKAIKN